MALLGLVAVASVGYAEIDLVRVGFNLENFSKAINQPGDVHVWTTAARDALNATSKSLDYENFLYFEKKAKKMLQTAKDYRIEPYFMEAAKTIESMLLEMSLAKKAKAAMPQRVLPSGPDLEIAPAVPLLGELNLIFSRKSALLPYYERVNAAKELIQKAMNQLYGKALRHFIDAAQSNINEAAIGKKGEPDGEMFIKNLAEPVMEKLLELEKYMTVETKASVQDLYTMLRAAIRAGDVSQVIKLLQENPGLISELQKQLK